MSEPLVSVIITTFGGSGVLARAIDSVLAQTYSDFELLVVDDNDPASPERQKTEAVMAQYAENAQVIYLKHEKNKNGSAARNTGIRAAKGEYIAFLDDDDVYFPERLSECVTALLENPDKDSVLTGVAVTNGSVLIDIIEQKERENPLRDMFFGNPLGTGSNLFLTRRAVDALGGFDESFLRRQDVEFMVRFYRTFRSVYLNRPLAVKVVSPRLNVKINYSRFRSIEEHFIKTFRDVIDGVLSEEDRNAYFDHTYTVLFRIGLISSPADAREAAKRLVDIRPLTAKERVTLHLCSLYRALRNTRALYCLKKRGEVKKVAARAAEKKVYLSAEEFSYMKKISVLAPEA